MLGARGVALGLGRVNLNDLSGLSATQMRQAAAARSMAKKNKAKAPKVVIKKHVDRQTLWAACRAVLFGTVLIALGATMATIGYYAESLATLSNTTNGTVLIDKGRKLQFASLSYVGPVVMGVGAFILMIACVMTLESRDKHAQVVHEYARDGKISRNPSSRKQGKPLSEEQTLLNVQTEDETNNNNNEKLPQNNQELSKHGDSEVRSEKISHSDTKILSKNLLRQDSNATSGKANDSFPASTATTTLTLSKSMKENELGGKFPSTSCIDVLMKKADTRALLKRFLEDQSKMAVGTRTKTGSLKKQSNSLEIPGSEKIQIPNRNVRSEEMPVRHNIVAEVHPPPLQNAPPTLPRLPPIVRAESIEQMDPEDYSSPMSVGSDNQKTEQVVPRRNCDTQSVASFVTVKSSQSGAIQSESGSFSLNPSPSTINSEFHSSVTTLQEAPENGNRTCGLSEATDTFLPNSGTPVPRVIFNS